MSRWHKGNGLMTVAQLLKQLQALDPTLAVFVVDEHDAWCVVSHLEPQPLADTPKVGIHIDIVK